MTLIWIAAMLDMSMTDLLAKIVSLAGLSEIDLAVWRGGKIPTGEALTRIAWAIFVLEQLAWAEHVNEVVNEAGDAARLVAQKWQKILEQWDEDDIRDRYARIAKRLELRILARHRAELLVALEEAAAQRRDEIRKAAMRHPTFPQSESSDETPKM